MVMRQRPDTDSSLAISKDAHIGKWWGLVVCPGHMRDDHDWRKGKGCVWWMSRCVVELLSALRHRTGKAAAAPGGASAPRGKKVKVGTALAALKAIQLAGVAR